MWQLQNITDKSLQLIADNYPDLELLNLTRYVCTGFQKLISGIGKRNVSLVFA